MLSAECQASLQNRICLDCDLITLTFDFSTSKWGHRSPMSWASCPFSAGYAIPFLTYGQVWDRQTHDSHQWIIPPPYGDDGITSRWLHQTTRQQQQQQPRSDLDLDYRCHVYFSHVNRHRLMYTVRWRRYHQPALTTLHTYIYTHISSDLSQQTRHEVMLVSWLVFNHTFSTNRLYRVIAVGNISRRAGGKTNLIIKQWNNTLNQEHHKHSSAWALWRRSPRHG